MFLKTQPVRSNAMRRSAKGHPCTLRLPGVCNGDSETTVLAHLPFGHRGIGTKASDDHAVYACSACHDVLDRRTQGSADLAELYECCLRGLSETHEHMRQLGIIAYKGAA